MPMPNTSPFVLVGKYAGLQGFDSFMNVVILVSRPLHRRVRRLRRLAYPDRPRPAGIRPQDLHLHRPLRPPPSQSVTLHASPSASLPTSPSTAKGPTVFDWLLSLSGLAALFTWGSICLAHIRFRAAWKHQGHTLDEIPFKAIGGVYGATLAFVPDSCQFSPIVLTSSQFYVAICPVGQDLQRCRGLLQGLPRPARRHRLLDRRLAVEAPGLAPHSTRSTSTPTAASSTGMRSTPTGLSSRQPCPHGSVYYTVFV